MKKSENLIVSFLFALILSGFIYSNSFTNSNKIAAATGLAETNIEHAKFLECKYGQCKATAKSTGKRCKHCVSNDGDKYCWQHK